MVHTKELYVFKIRQKTNALYLRELHTWSGDKETFKGLGPPPPIQVALVVWHFY